MMGGCSACSRPASPTGRRSSPCSRACRRGAGRSGSARPPARPAAARPRPRRSAALRIRPVRDPDRGPARPDPRLARSRSRSPTWSSRTSTRTLMGVTGELEPGQAPHPSASRPRRPRRIAEVRVRRRPQRAGAGERARDGGPHDGRHVLPVVPRRAGGRRSSRTSCASAPSRCRRAPPCPGPTPSTRSTGRRCAASTRTPRRRWWPRSTAAGRLATPSAASSRCWPTARRRASGRYVHYDRKLDGRLALALMSIQSVKGVEIGDGFATRLEARLEGARRDRGARRSRDPLRTARAGGIEGGMSTGEPIRVRAAMKPFSTVPKPLATVDIATGEPAVAIKQRTDVCAVPAGGRRRRVGGRVRAGATRCSRSSAATRCPRRGATCERYLEGLS